MKQNHTRESWSKVASESLSDVVPHLLICYHNNIMFSGAGSVSMVKTLLRGHVRLTSAFGQSF